MKKNFKKKIFKLLCLTLILSVCIGIFGITASASRVSTNLEEFVNNMNDYYGPTHVFEYIKETNTARLLCDFYVKDDAPDNCIDNCISDFLVSDTAKGIIDLNGHILSCSLEISDGDISIIDSVGTGKISVNIFTYDLVGLCFLPAFNLRNNGKLTLDNIKLEINQNVKNLIADSSKTIQFLGDYDCEPNVGCLICLDQNFSGYLTVKNGTILSGYKDLIYVAEGAKTENVSFEDCKIIYDEGDSPFLVNNGATLKTSDKTIIKKSSEISEENTPEKSSKTDSSTKKGTLSPKTGYSKFDVLNVLIMLVSAMFVCISLKHFKKNYTE